VPSIAAISDSKFVVTAMNSDGGTDDVFATFFHGMLTVTGSNSGSTIGIAASAGQVVATVDGSPTTLDPAFDMVSIAGGTGNDRITGGSAADSIAAGDGNDTVDGMDGDDRIDPGAGDDAVSGGNDTDTLTYQSRSESLTVRIDGGTSGAAGETDTISADFEN